MFSPQSSFFDGLSDRLELAVFDTNQELRMKRRLTEPAFIDGQMRQAGYEFDDRSAGPHRRNDDSPFAYHPQFVELEGLKPVNPVVERLKAKALQARGIAGGLVKSVESELDLMIAEKDAVEKKLAEAVAPHHEIFAGVRGEIDGVKAAIDLLSNGGPPLSGSGDAPKT
jgi:hypothetical protein